MTSKTLHLVLVMVAAGVIIVLDLSHTRGMAQIRLLIWARPTKVLYDLCGACVQAVEVSPLVAVKANPCVAVNTSQPVHQLRAHFSELVFARSKSQILTVCDHLQRPGAPCQGLTCALDVASNPFQPNGHQAQ